MSAKVAGYRVHPAAEMFPMMGAEGLAELAKDIEANGQLEEVVLLEGSILDGRNRAAACELAGVEVETREWSGDEDPWEWVASKNLHRRHLTDSQRAMVGAALEVHFRESASKRQAEGGLAPIGAKGKASEKAAKAAGSTTRSVERAGKVLKGSPPEVVQAVNSGDVSIADAARASSAPKSQQKAALAKVRSGEAPTMAAALGGLAPIGAKGVELHRDENGEEIRDPEIAAAFVLLRDRVKVVAQHLQNGKNAWGRIDEEVEAAGMKRIAFASAYRSLRKSIEEKLAELIFAIKSDAPFALCTFCKGEKPADGAKACKFCSGAGWTTELGYATSMEGVGRAQAKEARR